jgi:hypothetical protein
MSPNVEGAFQVSKWDENTYEELGGGSKLTKVSIVQGFSHGLDAEASWEGEMFYREDGTAYYTGLQRFVGTLDGREGTFVADTRGGYDGSTATSEWRVVPGSGTGALSGLSGTGTATAGAGSMGGTFVFDFDIG